MIPNLYTDKMRAKKSLNIFHRQHHGKQSLPLTFCWLKWQDILLSTDFLKGENYALRLLFVTRFDHNIKAISIDAKSYYSLTFW